MANGRHKRDTDARPSRLRRSRLVFLAAPVALALTGGAVALGVTTHGGGSDMVATDAAPTTAPTVPASTPSTSSPSASSSPAAPRTSAKPKPKPTRTSSRPAVLSRSSTRGTKMYAEVDLNLWTAPGAAGQDVGLLHQGDPAMVTGLTVSGRQQVVIDGVIRWVTAGNLSTDKPAPTRAAASSAPASSGALSDAPCPDGSVEKDLKSETIRLYHAVCHAFPEVKTYYGWGARTEHDTGNALDLMVYGDKALGDRIADWAQAHAAQLDLYDVIWYDRIWTPARSSEGWRDYGDHGSATANHMDHVHLGTN